MKPMTPGILLKLELDRMRQTFMTHLSETMIPNLKAEIDAAIAEVLAGEALRDAIRREIERIIINEVAAIIRSALFGFRLNETVREKIVEAVKVANERF